MQQTKNESSGQIPKDAGIWQDELKIIMNADARIQYPTGLKLNSIMTEYFQDLQRLLCHSFKYIVFLDSELTDKAPSLPELKELQDNYFSDVYDNGYGGLFCSFANPYHAVVTFGPELGRLLSMVYAEFRHNLLFFIQGRFKELIRLNRLFLELFELAKKYDLFEEDHSDWFRVVGKYVTENLEETQLFNLQWKYSPATTYFKNIVLNADLNDLSYLYRYGIYISEHVLKLAQFVNSYPENELQKLSKYIVQSYRDGFERTHRTYKNKKYAVLTIPAGMERLGRIVIADLEDIGLEAVVAQPQAQSIHKQFDYEHRFSMAVFYDQAYVDLLLPACKKAAAKMKDVLGKHAGPVFIELFGEEPFSPKDMPGRFELSDEQRQLLQESTGQMTQMFYQYYKRETTSFSIIAFPSPEIGNSFEQIFADTLKLNMLDSLRYAEIQQKIIDVLDTAQYIHVRGKGRNETDITVKLHPLKNPDKETNFENCVADVNVPVGEVFTSPLLKGTNGTLHVKDVYLRNLRYKNLKITFENGMISDYSCSNFEDQRDNRKYIEQNILHPHKTLPIGEFAIGTNTLAYQMALKYDIMGLLPILILEKTGPHFAVGDTCYTREEDIDHCNFYNGKKLIGVENEKTALRKTDPLQAYTQVHTDITLPYNMLKSIEAICQDGTKIPIIKNGLFAVPGTEELNVPLREILLNKKEVSKRKKGEGN